MSKEIYISSTPHETRLAIVENDDLSEMYYERENEYTLAGSIYNGKVTRVLPGMQSAFVDIGLERDAFLYITDFMEEAGESAEFESAETAGQRRGRGDRGGRTRRETGSGSDQTAQGGTEPERDLEDESRGAVPAVTAPLEEMSGTVSSSEGERDPATEGSRRWRGRRGRRRGRGSSERELRPESVEGTSPASPSLAQAFPGDAEEGPDMGAEENLELGAAAEDRAADAAHTRDSAPDGEGHAGGAPRARDEDPANQRRGDRRFADRRAPRAPRAPRGFAPSRGLYGLDEREQTPADSAGERVMLPGESLAKYRPDAATESKPVDARPAPTNASAAASEFVLSGAWNGGDVMPGETLRPRGQQENRPEKDDASRRGGADPRQQRRGERPNGGHGRGAAPDAQREVPPASAASLPEPAGLLVVAPVVAPDVAPASDPALTGALSAGPAGSAPETTSQSGVPDEAVTDLEHQEAMPAEYEPVEASASYRVDPAPPREYRQAAPVTESEEQGRRDDGAPPPEASSTHSITPPAGAALAPLRSESTADVAPAHEFTAISPEGEMLSELAVPQSQEVAAPAAPIEHETAVLEEASAPTGTEFAAPGFPAERNEPVELIEHVSEVQGGEEQDEAETAVLQASAIEEIDPDEEETLEGAADLGSMIREMSIDEITMPDDSVSSDALLGDEVDFEEEDASETSETIQVFDQGEGEFTSFAETEADPELAQDFGAEQTDTTAEAAPRDGERRGGREGVTTGRRHARRDARYGGREERARSTGNSGVRQGRRDHHRHSAQTTNLPAISDLLKPGQELLVQIAKEPIAKKGARITSHIALPGRFLVFMPTVNHMGVSRKIESDGERRRLKEILLSEKGEATGGFIVRTAAAGASEEELRSDLRFLLNLWADIKQRSDSSKSPALIYHDLNLVERILRDQVTDNFSAIWVDTEGEYERVLRFLQRFQPSLIRRVKLYTKETPLFEQFGLQEEINKALRSKVWLKSGGSIVINQTEALVAIDINTGKYVGKTARLEDTIVKTNLDAIPEIVRQIRLRDLGGIIIIDFIDMDERKNRHRVMAALEEELKKDRAPSKVLQFNDFGLVAITRKRVKQSLERTLSTTCNVCTGTGMVKSPVTVCNEIFVEMRKMQKHLDRGDVMLRVNPEVVKQLKSPTAKWLQEMEDMIGKTVLVKSDPTLHPEQFDIH